MGLDGRYQSSLLCFTPCSALQQQSFVIPLLHQLVKKKKKKSGRGFSLTNKSSSSSFTAHESFVGGDDNTSVMNQFVGTDPHGARNAFKPSSFSPPPPP